MDGFELPELSKIEEKHRLRIQSKIEFCVNCQPFDEGEAVWIHGERIELEELLCSLKIPEKYWNNVVQHLSCPNCGNEYFDESDEVGIETKFDREINEHMDKVSKIYGSQVKDFEELLEKFPFLAYSNKFGKRIYMELKEKKLPTVIINGVFFRARRVESSEVFTKDKMYHPPTGKPQEGRFNHAGQSHLYLSNDERTAINEVVADEHSVLVWSQTFEISEDVDNILDLSFDWAELTTSTSTLLLSLKVNNSIGRDDRNKELWRPDYYLTRFIMDCAKEQGYNGIKYNSTKSISEFDVVLFYPEKLQISPKGDPRIKIFLKNNYKDEFRTTFFDQ